MKSKVEYFVLAADNYLDGGIQGYFTPEIDISFFTGKTIREDIPLLTFEVDYPKGHQIPHLLDGGTILMSERMVNLLRTGGIDNFQTYPVMLYNPETGERWTNYFAINIIGLVQAADLENSEFDILMPGDDNIPPLLAFDSITLLKEKLNELLIFRMTESPGTVIIHKRVRDLLVNNKPDGGWGIMMDEVMVSD